MTALQPGAPPKPRKRAKRRGHADPVSPELYRAVNVRDGGCVAPRVCECIASSASLCGGFLTLNHVKDEPMLGKRAPSDARHLVVLCSSHHIYSGWEAAHHAEQRAYLARVQT